MRTARVIREEVRAAMLREAKRQAEENAKKDAVEALGRHGPTSWEEVVAGWSRREVHELAGVIVAEDGCGLATAGEWDVRRRSAEAFQLEALARMALRRLYVAEVGVVLAMRAAEGEESVRQLTEEEARTEGARARDNALREEIDSAVLAVAHRAAEAAERIEKGVQGWWTQIWKLLKNLVWRGRIPAFGPLLMDAYEEVRRRCNEEGEKQKDACQWVYDARPEARGNWSLDRFEDGYGVWKSLVRSGKGPNADAFFEAKSASDKKRNLRRKKK